MIRRLAVIAAGSALLAAAPAADASTSLGQLFTPTASTTATIAQTGVTSGASYTVPSNGVITGWTFLADSDGAQLKLKAVRPIDGGQYSVVGESALQAVTGGQQQSFATRIPVNAGDLIGTAAASGKSVAYTGAQGDNVVLTPGDQPPGTSGGFSNVQGIRTDVVATLEPDADGDGYGDETQDLCPTDPSLQTRCTSNLNLTVTADKRTLNPGSVVTFGLTVHNFGPSAASAVQVVTELSPELQILSSAGGACSGDQTLTCNMGDLPKDGDAVLRVLAKATTLGPATIAGRVNSATVESDDTDNGAGMSVAIVALPNLCATPASAPAFSSALARAAIACLVGGDGIDHLTGTNAAETIIGNGGNDFLDGRGGADTIEGDSGGDTILGGAGNDILTGGTGNDRISGQSGNDVINGGPGTDRITGGAGNDRINVVDRKRDSVDCGPGKDRVTADKIDRLTHCERVKRTRK